MPRRTPLALLLLLVACKGEPPARDLPPATREHDARKSDQARQPDLSADAADPRPAVQVDPVQGDRVPELLEARELCDALHLLAERRRSACCTAAAPSTQAQRLADRCSQLLSSAAASGGVVLRDDARVGCIDALEATYTDCDWVGPWSPPLPPLCLDAVVGTLTAESRCRSSLECAPGLHCAGAGPTAMGVCSSPAADGAACDPAADALASHLRDDRLAAHPPCAGRCIAGSCRPPLTAGAACSSNDECAAGLHCDGDTCIAGELAAAGAPCADGGCAVGSQCLEHRCTIQRPTGAACKTDRDCRGACQQAAAGPRTCGPKC